MMKKQLGEATRLVEKAKSIQVITHLDADGLSAGGIISQTLERAGKDFEIKAVPGIYENNAEDLSSADLTIFTDLGSGQLDFLHKNFKNDNVIVLDHHQPHGQTWSKLVQVNPHLIGKDGSREISGAGVAYHFAVEMSSENVDLSQLAVVGAKTRAGRTSFVTQPIRITDFVAWLRDRYGILIDSTGNAVDSPEVSRGLEANYTALKDRLRQLGFFTDLSDASISQVIRPRFPINGV